MSDDLNDWRKTHYTTDVSTLSAVAGKTNLTTGELIAWWDNSNQVWRGWIVGFSTTNYNTNQYDVFVTLVNNNRYFQIG